MVEGIVCSFTQLADSPLNLLITTNLIFENTLQLADSPLNLLITTNLIFENTLQICQQENHVGIHPCMIAVHTKLKESFSLGDDDEEYNLLEEVLQKSENGQLLGQKVKAGKMFVDAVKSYQLRYLTGLPASSTKTLLEELSDGMMTLGQFKEGTHTGANTGSCLDKR
ncbi:hypothetical protein BSL78_28658 [Apostichopus japonicus]|uniref:Uncharacterized protein n=1 Tax=Stichopus japonicus TaxID=307972 RepID=A0A2G8JFK3_STIJA|nr:hypothetical protein BSL78_28658 [Apostichopus japonicus]